MNRIIQNINPDKGNNPQPAEDVSKLTETVKKVAEFDFSIKKDQVVEQIPFLSYCCLLIIIFIFNTHRSENLIRNTDKLKKEVKELRSEYISLLSSFMSESKQSSVAKKLATSGIKELKSPPVKISYGN